jgi:hypothetical protein
MKDQIQLINDAINKTKENLKESSFNFIFWGLLIAILSFFHYSFPEIVQKHVYSTMLYWVLIPVLGMITTIVHNVKKQKKVGYETYISRALKIIWGVFNISWIVLIFVSFEKKINPTESILFLLGVMILITGLLIRFKPFSFGGVSVVTCSILCVYTPNNSWLLLNGIAAILGLLVPGIALYYRKSNV